MMHCTRVPIHCIVAAVQIESCLTSSLWEWFNISTIKLVENEAHSVRKQHTTGGRKVVTKKKKNGLPLEYSTVSHTPSSESSGSFTSVSSVDPAAAGVSSSYTNQGMQKNIHVFLTTLSQ